jgi:hypothetical protein
MSETQPPGLAGGATPILLPKARRISPDEEDVVLLTAYALAAAAHEVPTPEAVEAKRHQAMRLLTDHAFRTLHNEVAALRRDAVSEFLAGRREVPSMWGMVGASFMALLLSSVLILWVLTQPERLVALVTALGR